MLVVAALAGRAEADPGPGEPPGAEPAAARVRVSGFWWVKNRDLRELLGVLEPEGRPLPVLDAAFIEDAVLVLQSALIDDGFLRASGTVRLRLEDGSARAYPWSAPGLPELPRDLAAVDAEFSITPGVLYFYDQLQVDGLTSISAAEVRSYFVNDGALLGGRKARKFSAESLDRGCESVRVRLRRLGRMDARVVVAEKTVDDATGAVSVRLQIEEGPLHRLGSVGLTGDLPEDVRSAVEARVRPAVGGVYSTLARQDLVHQVHLELYAHGYANAEVHVAGDSVRDAGDERLHALDLGVGTGPLVRVGEVRFAGDEQTRESVLRRATDARPGQLFDRNRVEADRLSLSSLGAFSAVRADVDEQAPDLWDLTYQLRPSKRLEAGLLAGYGSYERWRGGLEVFHANQFGRAERGRLQIVESTKSQSAEYQLTVPQVFGTTATANMRAYGLDREEVSFDRIEAGVSVGARRHSERFGVDVAGRYQFESLRAEDVVPDLRDEAPEDSRVGAITFDISQDRRDNPLTPKGGYELSLALETAAQALGGDVNYQKLDLKASWHARVGRTAVLHAGLRHGVIWGFGDSTQEIPINKRFFPGGDTTVRGYAEGTAAPRGETGEVIGAEVSTIANLELEAALIGRLSALAFVDAGLTSASIDNYPGDELRVSVGAGLRYNSLIGPIRLEYGYNVVRETGDDTGQLHFSLGFPF
ncbi:MAG: BamA/TamA family outer membrane protein [Opitutaceae bacterium]|nr:BamA/TamA family outer membrane protein [Opitutaceae bacterium]